MATHYKIICPDTIRRSMMNNDDMVKQFIELYLIQCPIDLDSLTKSINQKDAQAIGSAAHHIKPTMEYIGAKDLKNDFHLLEKLGYNNSPFEEILSKYEKIKSDFSLMLKELEEFKKDID